MTVKSAWVVILCGDLNQREDEKQNTHLAFAAPCVYKIAAVSNFKSGIAPG